MTPNVIAVKALPHYQLALLFENGEQRLFDMTDYLTYPAFSALAEDNLFMAARVSYGTVIWTDEIDISADTLYLG